MGRPEEKEMTTTYCVWAKVPRRNQGMAGKQDGWSRVTGGLTQKEAGWFANKIYFLARAMPDAMPGHTVPVMADAADVSWEDDDDEQPD